MKVVHSRGMETRPNDPASNSFVFDANLQGYGLSYVMAESNPADGSFGMTRWDVPVVLLRSMDEVDAYLDSEAPPLEKAIIRNGVFHASCRCREKKQFEAAIRYLRVLAARTPVPEEKAEYLLSLGQSFEQLSDFGNAAAVYREGVNLEPTEARLSYYLHNNLGYCLNQLGRHVQAESFCRTAIRIDPKRFNAHKNLGLARLAQGHAHEAARHLTVAAVVDPGNRRSFDHLTELLQSHPELLGADPQVADAWARLKDWWSSR